MSDGSSSVRRLREAGLRPKKSFGQNFLQDARTAERIAELCTTPAGGTVVEIGAGLGALTAPLLARASRVIAVERDRDLVPLLAGRFEGETRLDVLEADAKQIDLLQLLARGPRPHVVAGNLPYQITGPLLQRTTAVAASIDRAVFMVQREVAERLAAGPGSGAYGAPSVFAQAAFEVSLAFKVAPGAFHPVPKVESAVVVLVPRALCDETDAFREVVRRAFSKRRKKLKNALAGLYGWSADELQAHAAEAGIDLDLRAEMLGVADFAALARTRTG